MIEFNSILSVRRIIGFCLQAVKNSLQQFMWKIASKEDICILSKFGKKAITKVLTDK